MSREFRRRKRKQENREKRAKEKEMFYTQYYDIEYIKQVTALHDWNCVFELGAPQKIADRLSIRSIGQWLDLIETESGLEEFKNCFQQSEIYCPHEGIDRTKEVGVNLNWS